MTKLFHYIFGCLSILIFLIVNSSSQNIKEDITLQPDQTVEREMTGKETHRYKFDLKKDEFFQVRVEQKGVDVMLKLLDSGGTILATMNSPNGKEGLETLSFTSDKNGEFILEVGGFDEKAEKAIYSINRIKYRTATALDKKRVETERIFVETVKAISTKEQNEIAIPKLEQALNGWRELNDEYLIQLTINQISQIKKTKAAGLSNEALGLFQQGTAKSYQSALEKFQQAISIYEEINDTDENSGFAILFSGLISDRLGEKRSALSFYEKALKFFQTNNYKNGESSTLNNIGGIYYSLGENQKALFYFNQSLLIFKDLKYKPQEATTLNNIGGIYSSLGENQKALEYYNQSLLLSKEMFDKSQEAVTLSNIGEIYSSLGEKQKALEYHNLALPIFKTVGNKAGEATTLNNIGLVYSSLGEKQKALEYYNQSLPLSQAVGDKPQEATTLNNIGSIYSSLGEMQKALEYFNQSLPVRKIVGDKAGEATTLSNIGGIYYSLGEKQKALEYYNESLPLSQTVGNKSQEATTLNNIGSIYSSIGELQKALEYYNQALSIGKSIGDKPGNARTLNNIGSAYSLLGENQKSLESYEQALSLLKVVGDKLGEARNLNNIGLIYFSLGEKQKALEYYSQSLPLTKDVGDKSQEATTLNNIGVVYSSLGEKQKALEYYSQSLPIRKSVEDKAGGADTLNNIMFVWYSLGNQKLAIFYGKKSVNLYQQLRSYIQGLDIQSQRVFLKKLRDTYETLIEILISSGRYAESVEILNLYQDQQFFDFNRDLNSKFKTATLTSFEQFFENRISRTLEDVKNSMLQIEELNSRTRRDPLNSSEKSKLVEAKTEFNARYDNFLNLVKQGESEFPNSTDETNKVLNVADVVDLNKSLQSLDKSSKGKSAVIYTLIGKKTFHILLMTANTHVQHFQIPVKAENLNEKIKSFYALLQSDVYDTNVLGRELYDIIFKPVKAELEKQNVKTIMWQLDGNLRYIPMSALFDGEKFLAERYQNVVFTRTDFERLTRNVTARWTGIGFGTSQAKTVSLYETNISFLSLPGVNRELQSIFKTDNKSSPLIKGETLVDEKFTKENFYRALQQNRQLVHISSHFIFRSGDDLRSFLLTGDGSALTLNEFKQKPDLFKGVELLTLSACNTAATQADANGREIDGFAELAQRLGAGAVMATLWQVSDASTPWLMKEFYSNRQNGRMNKAEALQKAQMSLLKGTAEVISLPNVTKSETQNKIKIVIVPKGARNDDQKRSDVINLDESEAPRYNATGKPKYAHPYYWSLFILYGNWK